MAEYVATITTKIHCPDSDSPDMVKHGFQNGQQRYRCKPWGNRFRYNDNPAWALPLLLCQHLHPLAFVPNLGILQSPVPLPAQDCL